MLNLSLYSDSSLLNGSLAFTLIVYFIMASAIDLDVKPPVSGVIHADPTLIAEANLREQSTMANIREYRHKDSYGNMIGEFVTILIDWDDMLNEDTADPDLSNPTRPRMERPLDTIRSFEKAIDEGYKRRSTYKMGEWD